MFRRLTFAAVLFVAAFSALAQDNPATLAPGNWVIAARSGPTTDIRQILLEVESKDGKLASKVLSPERGDPKVKSLTVEGNIVSLTITIDGSTLSFDGTIDPKQPKIILGSFGDERRLTAATFSATDITEITRGNSIVANKAPAEMTAAMKMSNASQILRGKARQTKDADAKKELLKQAEDATKEADAKLPDMYKEVLAKYPGTFSAYLAANSLINRAEKIKAPADAVKAWAEAMIVAAAPYGKKYEDDTASRIAAALTSQTGYAATALPYAERTVKVTERASPARRVRALTVLMEAQSGSGKADAAKATEAIITKIDGELDAEFLKTVPPFKPKKYQGRTDEKANRVAVMELFTGAQCPPCVAADVAFDGLLKAYKPKDLILLQYHLHIPGPDPLTNEDTVARYDYYSKKFADDFGGTPSTAFNGKAAAGGGGGMANSEGKFTEFRGIIDEILEKSSDASLTGTAKRDGDAIAVSVEIAGLKEPDANVKVRVLLVEENIPYVGSNGLRFHHHVVRSLFGAPNGVPVKDLTGGKHTAKLSLDALRAQHTKYLDAFAKDSPFPNKKRPLEMKQLKAVALVQNDDTGEILTAIQFDVN